jgi:hypothetical protein
VISARVFFILKSYSKNVPFTVYTDRTNLQGAL